MILRHIAGRPIPPPTIPFTYTYQRSMRRRWRGGFCDQIKIRPHTHNRQYFYCPNGMRPSGRFPTKHSAAPRTIDPHPSCIRTRTVRPAMRSRIPSLLAQLGHPHPPMQHQRRLAFRSSGDPQAAILRCALAPYRAREAKQRPATRSVLTAASGTAPWCVVPSHPPEPRCSLHEGASRRLVSVYRASAPSARKVAVP